MTAPAEPIEALLFDFGRVVIDLDFKRAFARWAEHAGCNASHMQDIDVFGDAYDKHERGEIPFGTYADHLRGQMDADLSEEQLLDGWNAIYIGDMPNIVTLLEAAKTKLPIYGFTNSNVAQGPSGPSATRT